MKKLLTLAILFYFIFLFAHRIDAYNQSYMDLNNASAKGDILYRVFGELKNYMSDISDMQTDLYFHGGITDIDKEECNIMESENADRKAHDHAQHKHPENITNMAPANILLKTAAALSVTEHYHIFGDREKELLPWIYYSVKLNPNNEKTYVIGGYWLGFRLNKAREGISFLEEGSSNNPGSWEINLMLGEIYLIKLKEYAKAILYLEKAKELGTAQLIDKYSTRGVYTFLADAYARTGSANRSIRLYNELLNLFPSDRSIAEKLRYFDGLKYEAEKQRRDYK